MCAHQIHHRLSEFSHWHTVFTVYRICLLTVLQGCGNVIIKQGCMYHAYCICSILHHLSEERNNLHTIKEHGCAKFGHIVHVVHSSLYHFQYSKIFGKKELLRMCYIPFVRKPKNKFKDCRGPKNYNRENVQYNSCTCMYNQRTKVRWMARKGVRPGKVSAHFQDVWSELTGWFLTGHHRKSSWGYPLFRCPANQPITLPCKTV